MAGMNFSKIAVVLMIIAIAIATPGCKKQEHPAEQPEEAAKETALTKDQLADAVEDYVKNQSEAHDGYFMAYDDKTEQQLKLTLDKVHRKRLSQVGEQTYFACADFKTPQGKVYDLDVFMTGADKENLTFSKFMIHKEAGKERYTWYEKDGIWRRKPVGAPVQERPTEHPKEGEPPKEGEHPKEGEPPKEGEHPKEGEPPKEKEHPTEPPKKPRPEHPAEHPG